MLTLLPPEPLPPPAAARLSGPPQAPYHLLDGFLPDADDLRADFDRLFADPAHAGPAHQLWDYWYVPASYTYLRAQPERVIRAELVQRFVGQLRQLAIQRLGLCQVFHPYLSLYVNGCMQTLHNDARNGEIAYVYSLTDWDRRSFTGGETLIFRQEDYWRSGRFRQAGASTSFYDCVPALFNRLLLFDDCLIHGVPEVHGSMDPRQGRVVLHGHLSAGGLLLQGGAGAAAMPGLRQLVTDLSARLEADGGQHNGFLTLTADIDPEGRVSAPRVLLDRVFDAEGQPRHWPGGDDAQVLLQALRLPPSPQVGRLTVPLCLGR